MRKQLNENMWHKFDFGHGVAIVFSNLDTDTGQENVDYVYSFNKGPTFNYTTLKQSHFLDVEISSSLSDDLRLLHFLFDRTKGI